MGKLLQATYDDTDDSRATGALAQMATVAEDCLCTETADDSWSGLVKGSAASGDDAGTHQALRLILTHAGTTCHRAGRDGGAPHTTRARSRRSFWAWHFGEHTHTDRR